MGAVLESLVDDRLGPGPVSQELIRRCADYTGTSGGIAFREYRRAVEVMFDAMELDAGSTIVVSPLAPRVYHEVIATRGFRALYADVDANTGCISKASVAALVESGAAACLADSPAGFVPDLNALADLEIPLIEDISTNLGGNCLGRKCGSYGRFSIISLEERNIITAGGGAVVLARTKRDLGTLKKAAEKFDETYLLPDLNAALAEIQLKNIEDFITRRRDIAAVYTRSLARGKHRTFMQNGDSENVFFTFPVVLKNGVNDALKYARGKRIMAEKAFGDNIDFWTTETMKTCPAAHALFLRCVYFPLYPLLTREQIEQVARVLSTLP
ncbi:MAG: DegT/DnrJ/EryC1/StrS aminotransferase family protein [Spirochaetales bacterium]|nr:DegT/DnrJ/EryC1/StrS aminotransferase family protein [Spirochaetales bacterium]